MTFEQIVWSAGLLFVMAVCAIGLLATARPKDE
jgi:hypothetical protein